MKKILLILGLTLFVVSLNAQRIGRVKTVAIDTLTAAANDTSAVITASGSSNTITFQALCTQLGGTSDGKLVLQGSIDGTSYKTVTEKGGIYGYPVADSLTVTNGAVWSVVAENSPYMYWRMIGTGTASDTTLVTFKYVLK